ncbi:hypothetical protein MKX01_036278 [Papaver californicum]|nr:hypothetical protein MKX01_036278 [Papaver californicum]
MALKNVAQMLFQRFSSGSRSIASKNGGIETKHTVVRDDKLRSVCERLAQATEKGNQLKDECSAIFALTRAFPTDRVIWLGFIINFVHFTNEQAVIISKTRKSIKDKESRLSRTNKQESVRMVCF